MALATTTMRHVEGVVFYDGECAICTRGVRRFQSVLARRRITVTPLQTPDACARLAIREEDRLKEMRLRLEDGTVFGGAAAVVEIARRIWWATPLWALSRVPGAMRPMRAAYAWVARHRSCANGVCRIEPPIRRRSAGVLPLIALHSMALLLRSSLKSASLADFWGRRWNTAFHELATRFTFQPLRTRVGATAAALIVFLLSGVIHELVISLPAGGGYGLPTGYFVAQGLGVASERSSRGRRFGLGHGWRGRLFTVLVIAGPLYWLFPPVFVRRVILPMLAAIGAR